MNHPLVGKRIKSGYMPDDPDPLPFGTQGTVISVSEPLSLGSFRTYRQIDVNWDNGRTIMLVVPPDSYFLVE